MSKKIIHVCRLYLPHIGGVETHVSEISKISFNKGDSAFVISSQDSINMPLRDTIDGVVVHRIPKSFLKSKIKIWKWVLKNKDLFFAADVIHIHDVFWWVIPIYMSIHKKLFITFHGWEGKYPIRFLAKVHRLIASTFSSGVIHVGGWIKDFYWDLPDQTTYGGVKKSKLAIKNISPSKEKQKKSFNFVFIGRLDEDNDIKKYIELAVKLKSHFKQVNIFWIGDGAYKKICAQYGVVTGFISDYNEFLDQADIIGACSYLSIWQSLSRGKIVCAFFSNPVKKLYLDYFPEKHAIISSNNSEEMLFKLKRIISNKNKMLLISSEIQKKASSHTWKKVFEKYELLWRNNP